MWQLLLILGPFLLLSCAKNNTVAYNLIADKLCADYDTNEDAANSKYKDRFIVVSGIVRNIQGDVMDHAHIVLGSDDLSCHVCCVFAGNPPASFEELSMGQRVFVKGRVCGLSIGAVFVEDCRLIDQTG